MLVYEVQDPIFLELIIKQTFLEEFIFLYKFDYLIFND